MASATYTDQTDGSRNVEGGQAKWGDTVQLQPAEMPSGRNAYSFIARDKNQSTLAGWAVRLHASGNNPVSTVIGGGKAWAPLEHNGVPDTFVYIEVYGDDNDSLSDGPLEFQSIFQVQAP